MKVELIDYVSKKVLATAHLDVVPRKGDSVVIGGQGIERPKHFVIDVAFVLDPVDIRVRVLLAERPEPSV